MPFYHHKPERPEVTPDQIPMPIAKEKYEERAAIREFDGGQDRDISESQAKLETLFDLAEIDQDLYLSKGIIEPVVIIHNSIKWQQIGLSELGAKIAVAYYRKQNPQTPDTEIENEALKYYQTNYSKRKWTARK